MNNLQHNVFKDVFDSEAVAVSGTANSTGIDTNGLGDSVFVLIPTATDGAASVVKVQDSPDNSTWADVTGATLSTLPSATDDDKRFAIFVSRAGTAHDRYLRLVYTQSGAGATGATLTAFAMFETPNTIPDSATEFGIESYVIV